MRVAYAAGTIAAALPLRVTGNPASVQFLRAAAIDAAERPPRCGRGPASTCRPMPSIVHAPLAPDDRMEIDVPVQILGDAYITVSGTTRIALENVALPAAGAAPAVGERLSRTPDRRRRAVHRHDRPHDLAALPVLPLQPGDRTRAPRFGQSDQRRGDAGRLARDRGARRTGRERDGGRPQRDAHVPGPRAAQRRHDRDDPARRDRQHRQPRSPAERGRQRHPAVARDQRRSARTSRWWRSTPTRRSISRPTRRICWPAGRRTRAASTRCPSSSRTTRSSPTRRRSRSRSASCRCPTCAKAKRSPAITA